MSQNEMLTIKSSKDKGCVYTKADKGNAVVVLEKEECDIKMMNTIGECGYKDISKTPLSKIVMETKNHIKTLTLTFGKESKWKLNISNPVIPKLYGLPKVHKEGEKCAR